MPIPKKQYLLNTLAVDIGCSTCTGRPTLLAGNPKSKPTPRRTPRCSSSSSFSTTSSSSTNYSTDSSEIKSLKGLGVAVEKESDDPYMDFRRSMLQMILEKEMYAKKDLKELLNCFLQLNSPYYHGIIVRAFTEIWNGVYSVRASGEDDDGGEWKSRDF